MVYPPKLCSFCNYNIPVNNSIYMYSSKSFCSYNCRYLYMENEYDLKRQQEEIYELNICEKEIAFIFKDGFEKAVIEFVKMDEKKSNKLKKYISGESLLKLYEVQNKIIDDLITLEVEGDIFDEKRMNILTEYKKYDNSYLSKMDYYIQPFWFRLPCEY